jgi:hypothetical protein
MNFPILVLLLLFSFFVVILVQQLLLGAPSYDLLLLLGSVAVSVH